MKVELSAAEKSQLDRALQRNPVRKWMSNKDNLKFEVGDVVVKYTKSYDDKWTVENINSDNKMAQRYVYIFEDEFGIGYIKQLKVSNGQLGKELICLTDFDYSSTRFEVDPEYAENVLLDGDYDIKQLHKKALEARKIVIKLNRKLGTKPQTFSEVDKIFDSINEGDTFYTAKDYTGKWINEWVLIKKTMVTTQSIIQKRDWDYERIKNKNPKLIDVTDTYFLNLSNPSYNNNKDQRYAFNWIDYVIFKTKPAKVEDKK